MRPINLLGQRFSRLVVIEEAGRTFTKQVLWKCKCDCGNVTIVRSGALRRGKTVSCGCYGKEVRRSSVVTHGEKHSSTYNIWCSIKGRCLNSSNTSYCRYGAKGITVCDRWKNSFEAFMEDMGRRPSNKHTIDRIDNSKGYFKENCRWVTYKENNRNRTNTKFITFNGETLSTGEWAEKLGINVAVIWKRLKQQNHSIEEVLSPFNLNTGERLTRKVTSLCGGSN